MSLLVTVNLCWCREHTAPLLRLVNRGSLNDTDGYLVTQAQVTLQPITKLVGTADQTAHSQVQLFSTKAPFDWTAKAQVTTAVSTAGPTMPAVHFFLPFTWTSNAIMSRELAERPKLSA